MIKASSIKKNLRSNGHALTSDWLKIKNTFSDAATDVKDTAGTLLSQSVDEIKERKKQFQHKVVAYTIKKPFRSLGIALATGILLGAWFKR